MTGYGSAVMKARLGTLSIEIKAVNQRFHECQIRLPRSLLMIEDSIRKEIKKHVARGKIDVFVKIEDQLKTPRKLRVDIELLEQYIEAAKTIENAMGQKITSSLDVNALLIHSDIAVVEEAGNEQWIDEEETIFLALTQAIDSFNQMREKEGQYLFIDMQNSLKHLGNCCDQVEVLAPLIIEQYREKIETRLRDYLNEVEVDESRLLTEIGLFADKADISEELVRLRAHIKQFEHYCHTDEAVGRRLDFLLQEMNREANTIGSKATAMSIRQQVVEMKGFIEKLKEQVQNVE